jgi:hypothetical protein
VVALGHRYSDLRGHAPLEREVPSFVDHVIVPLLSAFGVAFLLLAQLRELMRQVRRTLVEWKLTAALALGTSAPDAQATSGDDRDVLPSTAESDEDTPDDGGGEASTVHR